MKSRSEVMKEKKTKPSAEARTVPLQSSAPGAVVFCEACEKESKAEDCTTRTDGFAECPSCGAPVTMMTRKTVAAEDPSPTQKLAEEMKAKKPPEPKAQYCGACGERMLWTSGLATYLYSCGHNKAEHGMIDDPSQAKPRAKSPSATGTPPLPVSTNVEVTQTGTKRLSLHWGEARLPYDQFNGIKVGGHIMSVDLHPDEDPVAASRKMIDVLENIADLLFDRQKAWYEERLKILSGDKK